MDTDDNNAGALRRPNFIAVCPVVLYIAKTSCMYTAHTRQDLKISKETVTVYTMTDDTAAGLVLHKGVVDDDD